MPKAILELQSLNLLPPVISTGNNQLAYINADGELQGGYSILESPAPVMRIWVDTSQKMLDTLVTMPGVKLVQTSTVL